MSYFSKLREYTLELELDILREIEEEGILVINQEDRGIANMILDCEDELLIIEQVILDIHQDSSKLYRRLLEINRLMTHGAFVLDAEGKRILYRDTLQLANLDLNELSASVNALSLTLIEFMEEFLSWTEAAAEQES